MHAGFQGGFNNILRPKDVRLDGFKRVVFGSWHLLERYSVHDGIYAFHGVLETVFVADITDKKAYRWILGVGITLGHFKLFEFIARIDDNALNLRETLVNRFDKFFPKEPVAPVTKIDLFSKMPGTGIVKVAALCGSIPEQEDKISRFSLTYRLYSSHRSERGIAFNKLAICSLGDNSAALQHKNVVTAENSTLDGAL